MIWLTVMVLEGEFFVTNSSAIESARERLARRERCMQLENASAIPACREFPEPESPESQPVGAKLQFCEGLNEGASAPCKCKSNGIDVECTFRICGYREGFYRSSNLSRFAARLAEELNSWSSKSLVSTEFVGFADGTSWGDKKEPKPQPLSVSLKSCMLRAARAHATAMSRLNEADYLDAELALLRGCALEEELAKGIKNFEFDSTPSFSFDSRKAGISDPNARAAELRFVAANSCGRLRYGQTR